MFQNGFHAMWSADLERNQTKPYRMIEIPPYRFVLRRFCHSQNHSILVLVVRLALLIDFASRSRSGSKASTSIIHENFRSIWDTKIGQIIVIAFHDDGKCIAHCYYCDKPYPNQSVVYRMPLISPTSFLVEIVVLKGSMVPNERPWIESWHPTWNPSTTKSWLLLLP